MLKGKAIALLQKIQAFQKLRPKELLIIEVIPAKPNPHDAAVDPKL
jgi:hypothetical protein